MTGGRLSRPERRQLQLQDAPFLRAPLDNGPDPRSMSAHLRHTIRLLQDRSSRSPCSDAVDHLTSLYERSLAPRNDIACKKGCSFCCSQDVAVTIPEAFFAAAAVRKDPAKVKAVLESNMRLQGVDPNDRLGRVLCPLLADDICSIYPSRPLACHSFISLRLQACLDTFVEHQPPQIPMPQDYINTLYTARMMLKAGLRVMGLDDRTFELTAAVAAILRAGDVEKRWLAGEDFFQDVQPDPPIPPQFETGIRQMAAYIAPTL